MRWYLVFTGIASLFTALYGIWTQSSHWGQKAVVQDPILAFFHRRRDYVGIATGYAAYLGTLADFMKVSRVIHQCDVAVAIFTLYQYCSHKFIHKYTNQKCKICKKFEPLSKFKSEGDDTVPLDECLEELEKKIRKGTEKLIRAYDPCMSCASHFLKINWK